ncbi:heavy metal translocating P-type ATPase [Halarsenatibacter silvermanii]|uniref:Cd(2+)-exporting ATPase n=1 Tax=Halarsenatibacter silvermanii TaxID=321763 RepID=A0A1G9R1H6_9FIRM|nr:heavy metal translocating P-type ATPase [Halarsenatibacter silvermanii]SDM16991.1 Cd2+/Zn2+-exporting ATPase [Halarsenatibacter silvermanii]
MLQKKFEIDGLSCVDCSLKIEKEVNNLSEVERADLNFATKELKLKIENSEQLEQNRISKKIKDIVNRIENDARVVPKDSNSNHDRNIGPGKSSAADRNTFRRILTGLSFLKFKILRLTAGVLLLAAALLLNAGTAVTLFLYLSAYAVTGYKVLIKTVKNGISGNFFDENFLMTIATLGAFVIGEYPEGVAVMLFYETGETVKDAAVNRSRQSIKALLDIKPEIAHLKMDKGIKTVSPEEVNIGDEIIAKPGERIPLDGVVVNGESAVDTSALTGESVPETKRPGDDVLSGSINKSGTLTLKVKEEFSDSTVNKILRLVEEAAGRKAKTERFITKFAHYYTPAVVLAAALLATIPPLILEGAAFSSWIYRALIFLVISCPCALVISIPLGFFGGLGSASRQGVLIKGANYLEALNDVSTVVMDKTGTITRGVFEVNQILPAANISRSELLKTAAAAELNSNHPIAEALRKSAGELPIKQDDIDNYREMAGRGVTATIKGEEILVGNDKLMEEKNVDYISSDSGRTRVHVAADGNYLGRIEISDRLKPDSLNIISNLLDNGTRVVMLTGDSREAAAELAEKAGLEEYFAELLPDDKVEKLEKIIRDSKKKTAFIGDGINDAPVLARADIGISMGGLGSDAAVEASDVVLMNDRLSDFQAALNVAGSTRRIVMENIIMALGIKGIFLLLGAFGLATMWGAVFADVGVALLAVLNSARLIKSKSDYPHSPYPSTEITDKKQPPQSSFGDS